MTLSQVSPEPDTPSTFRSAIFAGGGSRCLWQLGFWDGANAAGAGLRETVDYVASTSAGSAIATAALLDRGREAVDLFRGLTADNPRNIHWGNLLPGTEGAVLPHARMYRQALETFLSENDLQQIGKRRIEFLMARSPRYLRGGAAALAAFAVYGLEKHLTGVVHPSWTRRMGFEPHVRGNHDAESVANFIDMILASSCVPPVLPSPPLNGVSVLDGGMIDNVPAFLADERPGRTLVLLSKRYRKPLPDIPGRCYVQPSEPIRIDKFDYANPDGLEEAYQLGLGDGRAFVTGATS